MLDQARRREKCPKPTTVSRGDRALIDRCQDVSLIFHCTMDKREEILRWPTTCLRPLANLLWPPAAIIRCKGTHNCPERTKSRALDLACPWDEMFIERCTLLRIGPTTHAHRNTERRRLLIHTHIMDCWPDGPRPRHSQIPASLTCIGLLSAAAVDTFVRLLANRESSRSSASPSSSSIRCP